MRKNVGRKVVIGSTIGLFGTPVLAQQYQQEPATSQLLFDDFSTASLNTAVWNTGGNFLDKSVFDQVPTMVNSGGTTYAHFKFDTYDGNPGQAGQSYSTTQIDTKAAFSLPAGGAGIQYEARVKVEATGLLGPAGNSSDTSIPVAQGLNASIFSYTNSGKHDELDFENLTSQQLPVGSPNATNSNGATTHSNRFYGTSNGDGTLATSFHGAPSSGGSGNSYYAQYPYAKIDAGPTTPSANIYTYHTYDIDWYSNQIDWYIDGQLVREETSTQAGALIPTQAMPMWFNFWAPGPEFADANYTHFNNDGSVQLNGQGQPLYPNGLVATNNPALNQEYYYDVDYAKVSQIAPLGTAITPTWNGGGADNNWTNALNWSLTTVVAGNSLTFAGTTQVSTNNNFPAHTQFNGFTFASGAGAFVLAGNAVNLGGNITNQSSNTQTINLDLAIQQNTTISATSGDIAIGGAISGGFSITKMGSNVLTLSGTNTYTGLTTVSAGTLDLSATGSLASTSITVANGATFNVAGALPTAVGILANGAVHFGRNPGTGILVRKFNALSVGNGGLIGIDPPSATANRTVVVANTIGISGSNNAWQGRLDLNANDLIIHDLAVTVVANQIKQGFNGGNWLGTGGITSSAAAELGNPARALGYEVNNNGSGGMLLISFDGQTLAISDVIVKYTLVGDTNLDGSVNFSDLLTVAQHYNASNTSWNQGDFNYDGTTNFGDLLGLAQNYNRSLSLTASEPAQLDAAGGPDFAAAFAQAEAQVAVPEPTFSVMILAGVAAQGMRRRRAKP